MNAKLNLHLKALESKQIRDKTISWGESETSKKERWGINIKKISIDINRIKYIKVIVNNIFINKNFMQTKHQKEEHLTDSAKTTPSHQQHKSKITNKKINLKMLSLNLYHQ